VAAQALFDNRSEGEPTIRVDGRQHGDEPIDDCGDRRAGGSRVGSGRRRAEAQSTGRYDAARYGPPVTEPQAAQPTAPPRRRKRQALG